MISNQKKEKYNVLLSSSNGNFFKITLHSKEMAIAFLEEVFPCDLIVGNKLTRSKVTTGAVYADNGEFIYSIEKPY